jgi:hypothetical protein
MLTASLILDHSWRNNSPNNEQGSGQVGLVGELFDFKRKNTSNLKKIGHAGVPFTVLWCRWAAFAELPPRWSMLLCGRAN